MKGDRILVVDNEGHIAGFNGKFTEMWEIPQALLDRRIDYFNAYVCENLGARDEPRGRDPRPRSDVVPHRDGARDGAVRGFRVGRRPRLRP